MEKNNLPSGLVYYRSIMFLYSCLSVHNTLADRSSRQVPWPLPSSPSCLLRPAPPHSEPWLLFYVKSQWFLSSAVGWQRNSERTEKGFIYGKPGHPGNKDLFTPRVCPKSRGSVALLRFFPRREMEQTCIERILCALHFP